MNASTPPDPEELNTLFIAACDSQMEGKLEKAKDLYQQILVWVDAPLLQYNLGLIYYEQHKYTDALNCFTKAVKGNPEDLDALFNLALTHKACSQIEDAIATYLKLLSLEPDHIDGHYNLAGCFRELRQNQEAIEYYQKVLEKDPTHTSALNNVAYVYHLTENFEKALQCYRKLLKLNPEHQLAQHMIASIEERTPDKPPTAYIREVFDSYAEKYEESLVDNLHYSVPEKLRERFNNIEPEIRMLQYGIDLGCGTGLGGEAFADLVKEFDAVDLSEKMIEVAKEKRIYSALYCANVVEHLKTVSKQFDFFIGTDVFTYIGNLDELFSALSEKTQASAFFCFSTEHTEKGQFILRPTGRFAHSLSYIETLARNTGWQIILQQQTGLRKEKGEWIIGDLWILKKK